MHIEIYGRSGDLIDSVDVAESDLDKYKVPQLHTKILAAIAAGGRLEMGDWHRCETVHCRAGWCVKLAGEAGKQLEDEFGPGAAGAIITLASCPWLFGVADFGRMFYEGDDEAMADIKACAAKEAEVLCTTTD